MADKISLTNRMHDRNFGLASFKFNRWSAELEEGQTLEDALRTDFWANQADKIAGADRASPRGVGDIIEVRQPSTNLFAELMVLEVGPGFVEVMLVRQCAPEPVEAPQESPFTTKWHAGKRCHEVIRKNDSQVIKTGFQSKKRAVAWIEKNLAAAA